MRGAEDEAVGIQEDQASVDGGRKKKRQELVAALIVLSRHVTQWLG